MAGGVHTPFLGLGGYDQSSLLPPSRAALASPWPAAVHDPAGTVPPGNPQGASV